MTGKYIVIEGIDGTGKSTQAELLAARLRSEGREVVELHEPGGARISNSLRDIIKNKGLDRSALTNVLLFTAARSESWRQIALPTLERGGYVIAARNYFSTLAYQGYAEGLDGGLAEDLALIENLTRLATDDLYMQPNHAFLLDIADEKERAERIEKRGESTDSDIFETRNNDFQQKILNGYRQIAKDKNLNVIWATQPIETIADEIYQKVME